MKKILLVSSVMLITFSLLSSFSKKNNDNSLIPEKNLALKIIFGTKSRPNGAGTGCEGDKGLCLIIKAAVYDGGPVGTDMAVGDWGVTNPETMRISILKQNANFPTPQNTFYVLADYAVSPEVAHGLGYSNVTVRRGRYPINYSSNPLGDVDVRVITE